MLRLFVAVDLPAKLRPAVAGLAQGIGGARWTRPEQLHVTLRFLGDTPEDRLVDLRARLRQVRMPGFELALRGTGVFPPAGTRKPARILWLGLDPPEPLLELALSLGCNVTVDTDAHAPGQLEWQYHGCEQAARVNVPADRVMNTLPLDDFLAWTAGHGA